MKSIYWTDKSEWGYNVTPLQFNNLANCIACILQRNTDTTQDVLNAELIALFNHLGYEIPEFILDADWQDSCYLRNLTVDFEIVCERIYAGIDSMWYESLSDIQQYRLGLQASEINDDYYRSLNLA